MSTPKKRLDLLVTEQYPHVSRQQVQSWIMQGKVVVNGVPVLKSGTPIALDAQIVVDATEPPYVSRAGAKLAQALDHFAIDVTDLVALDAGISTGGFTDCLLQRGIKKVYGIDVGYGQVHEKVSKNPRLVLHERTNLRAVQSVGELVDIVTLDLSFISLLKVIPTITRILKPQGKLVVLIKPQFEATRKEVNACAGVIKDPVLQQRIVKDVVAAIEEYGFTPHGTIDSPVLGGSGNKEFLAYFTFAYPEKWKPEDFTHRD